MRCLGLLLATQGQESLALQVKDILLTDPLWFAQVAARQHVCQLLGNDQVVFRDELSFGKSPGPIRAAPSISRPAA